MTDQLKMCRHLCARIRKNSGGRLTMAADSNSRSAMDPQQDNQNGVVDRLKLLYPAVDEEKTPLPRAWSAKEKYNYIGLSQNNLRVHYKGKSLQILVKKLILTNYVIGIVSFNLYIVR